MKSFPALAFLLLLTLPFLALQDRAELAIGVSADAPQVILGERAGREVAERAGVRHAAQSLATLRQLLQDSRGENRREGGR